MQAPLTICFDLTPCEMHDRFGGFGRYATTLLRHILAMPEAALDGIHLLALARSDGPPLDAHDALTASLDMRTLVPPWRHRWQRRLLVGRALRAAHVDVFHATTAAALPFAAGCPVVATVHDIVPVVLPDPRRGLVGRVRRERDRLEQRWRLVWADHLVAISATTARDVMRAFGVPADRITIVRHGVDESDFHAQVASTERPEVRARHQLPARWFVAVGSDHYRKNHRRLFDAWRRVSTTVPEGLVFVGKAIHDGSLHPIAEDIGRAGLADRVRWLQDVTDAELPAIYRQATALVAPSLYEGFGMTLLESMACGTPVVASRTDAHLEVGGDAAAYFDPTSVADMARALGCVSTNAVLREDLRTRGLARAAEFTWARAAKETVDVYRRIAGRG